MPPSHGSQTCRAPGFEPKDFSHGTSLCFALHFTANCPQLQSIFYEKQQCCTMARTEHALRPIIFSTKIYTLISTPNMRNPLFLSFPDFLPSAVHKTPKIIHRVKNWSWDSGPLGQGKNEQGNRISSPFHFCPDG